MAEWYVLVRKCLVDSSGFDLTFPLWAALDTRSYIPPVKIGEVMRGVAVGQVIESKSSKFPVGTYAIAMVGWSELGIVKEKDLEQLDLPKGGKLTDALGVLGTRSLSPWLLFKS
jgi:NADPH-dependent curcumin reductase CurA